MDGSCRARWGFSFDKWVPAPVFIAGSAPKGRGRFLCDAAPAEGGQVAELPGERRLSAPEIPGARQDGPIDYARCLADPGRHDLDACHRPNAAAVIEFIRHALQGVR